MKKRPKKMVTKTMLVRRAQMRYKRESKAMKRRKKPVFFGIVERLVCCFFLFFWESFLGGERRTIAGVETCTCEAFVRFCGIGCVCAVCVERGRECASEGKPETACRRRGEISLGATVGMG